MRLLTRNADGELSLIERTGRDIPPYAILSHTWDKDGEVSYNELVAGTGRHKPGYAKIEFCVDQAARDGLQYAWVDTCCIDRWNAEELSVSINSMFRWYRNARKCYVLLPDVHLTTAGTEGPDRADWETAFGESRWFRRGWTLQELIAPTTATFYSSEQYHIGDKTTLERQIHETTGIPVEALRGTALDSFSAEERMSWAEGRNTTEEEDAAYCLLGILDVQMPAMYGEGKANALSRLQRAVESDETAPFIVPFDRNLQFTGREPQLARLEQVLFISGDNVAITGTGGVGKTQLALELAHRTRKKHKDCTVLWIPAADAESLRQGYAQIAQRLDIAGWNEENADVMRLVQTHLSQENAEHWLLIYDNADDEMARLRQYLPRSKRGCIVFTTRNSRIVAELGTQNDVVEVPRMDKTVGWALLQKCMPGKQLHEDQRQETYLLLEKLNYLPLAITLAGAYIKVNDCTVQDYLSLLDKEHSAGNDVCKHTAPDSQDTRRAVRAAWRVSFQRLRAHSELTADCLSIMACIEPRDVPVTLLPAGLTSPEDAIRMLTEYGMVVRRPADAALDIHPLLHSITRGWLEREGTLTIWSEKAVAQLEREFPRSDHWNRHKWRRLFPHTQYVLKGNNGVNKVRMALMQRCAGCLSEDGRWKEAEELLVQVMESREMELEGGHSQTLGIMNSLALTYSKQGRLREAENLNLQVLENCETELGTDHPKTLTSMNNLASLYNQQGRWKAAEKLFVRVMESRRAKLGVNNCSTLTSMANLAVTYMKQGRWTEAEDIAVQVLEGHKAILGADHPETLISMANLASKYRDQGRWSEAEELFVQVVASRKAKLGIDHPDTLTSMGNLASTYQKQGRWLEAERLEVQVMETFTTKLGASHPHTLTGTASLASTYRNQGQWTKAEELEVQVTEARRTKLGADHPDTLISMANLAATYREQGRWKETEELQVQVIDTSKTKLGADHPSTLNSMANLAATYRKQDRWKEAEELEVQVLDTSMTKLGANHPDTLTSMANLAATYKKQDRWKEAEELQVQVLETRKTKLGPDHPFTLASMNNLAHTWKSQGKQEKALELMEQCLKLRTRVLGSRHPNTLTASRSYNDWQAQGS